MERSDQGQCCQGDNADEKEILKRGLKRGDVEVLMRGQCLWESANEKGKREC